MLIKSRHLKIILQNVWVVRWILNLQYVGTVVYCQSLHNLNSKLPIAAFLSWFSTWATANFQASHQLFRNGATADFQAVKPRIFPSCAHSRWILCMWICCINWRPACAGDPWQGRKVTPLSSYINIPLLLTGRKRAPWPEVLIGEYIPPPPATSGTVQYMGKPLLYCTCECMINSISTSSVYSW